MGYDQSKDKLIKLFEYKKENASLLFSVFSYDNGIPKLQFSRSYEKKDGSIGYGSVGRLNLDEIKFLKSKLDEIIEIMDKK